MGTIITEEGIVPAWLAAVAHLEQNGRRVRNMMVEIDVPSVVTAADKCIIALVDAALQQRLKNPTSVSTVAGTIFPQALYRRIGAAALSEHFLRIMRKAKKPGTWGTYAMRLMVRSGKNPGDIIYPLDLVVSKLKRAAGQGNANVSNYELGVHEIADLEENELFLCDVPLYDPARDGAMIRNQPCLSHLSFKLIGKVELELTAVYRSHYYAERALGNFIGLCHLMNFVAAESGVRSGRLTCISTDAHLDYESWGGTVGAGKEVMQRIRHAVSSRRQSNQ